MTKPQKKKKTVNYINNAALLIEVADSKEKGHMNDKLAHMLMELVKRYAKKGNFSGYTFNDDMQGHALTMLVRTWKGFDASRSQNPFAFYTQCIKNSFIQYINKERKYRDIRDALLTNEGLAPSFAYTEAYEEQQRVAKIERKEEQNTVVNNILGYE